MYLQSCYIGTLQPGSAPKQSLASCGVGAQDAHIFRGKHLASMFPLSSALIPAFVPAAIVGAGVLGLPYAMSYLGWAGGTVTLALSWVSKPPHLRLGLPFKHSTLDIH